MSKIKQVFIIGEQRSGSNLLRIMLNKSSEIVAPHPPHILLRFMDLLPLYGDLENNDAFKLLIDDVCQFVEKNPVPWMTLKLDREHIFNNCEKRTLFNIFKSIMDEYAVTHNSSMWVCKSMQNVRWIKELEEYFDQPKYIYLYRDPRDVTLSFQKAVVGHKHPYTIADKWTELQNLCISSREQIPTNRFYSLKYENLIEKPEECLRELCHFLEIEYKQDMLKYYNSEEAKNTASVSMLWANVKSPLMMNNSKKYLTTMNKEDQKIVESLSYKIMDVLKYDRAFRNEDLINFDKKTIDKYYFEDKKLQLDAEQIINKEDFERRKLQLDVIENIKNRKTCTETY